MQQEIDAIEIMALFPLSQSKSNQKIGESPNLICNMNHAHKQLGTACDCCLKRYEVYTMFSTRKCFQYQATII